MHSTAMRLVLAAVSVTLLVTPVALGGVKHTDHILRSKVITLGGKRAPGRDIVKYGLPGGKPASHARVQQYFAQLRRMSRPLRPMTSLASSSSAPTVQTQRASYQTSTPTQSSSTASSGSDSGWLAKVRQCESGGNYSTDTGNGFHGAYQFTQSTWESVGGSGNPANASPAEQDRRALILKQRSGTSPWPVCG